MRAFQRSKGLNSTGLCDVTTWKLLVEAHWKLGDRLLYLKTPMFRGDDVAQMQGKLSWLGFDTGKIDGTFGPNTHKGLADFQINVGMTGDGICGPGTIAELNRNYGRSSLTISNVKELIHFDALANKSIDKRIAVASTLALSVNTDLLRGSLNRAGFQAINLCHHDLTTLATLCNNAEVDLVIYLEYLPDLESTIAYFRGFQYTSEIGMSIAEHISTQIVDTLAKYQPDNKILLEGSKHRILQLTNAPCVLISLGHGNIWTAGATVLTTVLTDALSSWFNRF